MSYMARWLWSTQIKSHLRKNDGHCPSKGGDKVFFLISRDHMINEIRHPHPKSQRLYSNSNRTL